MWARQRVAEQFLALDAITIEPVDQFGFDPQKFGHGLADWLVTGDKDALLALEKHGRTKIVTAQRIAGILEVRR